MKLTIDEIKFMYTASMESVDFIHETANSNNITDEDIEHIKRNVDHLIYMKEQTYWTDEDLTPFDDAIEFSKSIIVKKQPVTSNIIGEIPIPIIKV